MLKIAVLDDYQNVALDYADWSGVLDGCEVTVFNRHIAASDAARVLAPFDILCLMRERMAVPASLLAALPKLKLIVATGAHNRTLDIEAARARGIAVSHTRGAGTEHATSEMTWALILAAARHVPAENKNLREGGWQKTIGATLHGRVLGVVGLGRVGRLVASIGRAFGMEVAAWSPNLTELRANEAGARLVTKAELFAGSDVVTLHMVLSDRTRGLIDAEDLKRMRETAILVNTSRGPLIDEAALLEAAPRIGAVALDCFDQEPLPAGHPFRTLDNVIATPHLGYVTRETYEVFFPDIVENIKAFLAGRPQFVFLHEGKSMMSEVAGVTRTLANYLVEAQVSDVPQAVNREAVRSLLNWAGCAIGGSGHETVDRALAAVAPFAGSEEATLFGRSEKIDPLNAALLNGISSHVFDFDDTHLKTIIHPAGPVASALMALAEIQPISGIDFLHAFILGVEAECRIGNAVYPAHYDIGWHITGTAGVFGAAAAAGKVLGLNAQQMTWALGIAGTQSSGFREMFGTMCKSLHPGRAAQSGLLSAFLARQNFTSSDRVLEAPRGFAHVMSTSRDFSQITEGLGEHFEISLNTYKPFACGIVIHPSIDGAIQLRNEFGLKADQIERIVLRVAPLVLELTGKRTPRVGLEGKFSVFHSVAVAIIRGAAGEREYSDACVTDPQVVALRDRVDAKIDPSVRDDEAYLTVVLKDGRTLERHVPHALGSLQRPMSDSDLEAKFLGLSDGILSDEQAKQALALYWRVEGVADAAELARVSVPAYGKHAQRRQV